MTAALVPPPSIARPSVAPLRRTPHLRVVDSPPSAAGDVDARADRLAEAFTARFGAAPQALWSVPGAVPLLGTHGLIRGPGLFLPVGRQALVAVRLDEDGRVELLSDIDLPRGVGLSAVAAERCALRLALRDLGRPPVRTPWTVPELVVRCARESAVVAVGHREDAVRPVPADLDEAGFSALLFDTGLRHLGADGALPARRRAVREVTARLGVACLSQTDAESLSRPGAGLDAADVGCARYVVGEIAGVESALVDLARGDVLALARAMTASHRSLSRDLRVTYRQVDAVVDAALEAGAAGARMTGGGFGGAVLALVPAGGEDEVAAEVRTAAARSGHPLPQVLRLGKPCSSRRII